MAEVTATATATTTPALAGPTGGKIKRKSNFFSLQIFLNKIVSKEKYRKKKLQFRIFSIKEGRINEELKSGRAEFEEKMTKVITKE